MGAFLSPLGIGAAHAQYSGPVAAAQKQYVNDDSGSDMSDMFRRSFGNGSQGDGMNGLPGMPPGVGGMPGMGGGGMQGGMGMGNPLAMLMGGGMGGMQGGGMQGGGQQGMQQQQYPYGISPPQGMRGGGMQGGGQQQQGGGMGDPLGIMQMLGGL